MASDDWRVTVTLHNVEDAGNLRQSLHEYELEEEARERLGGRVIVGGGEDDGVILLYAGSSTAAHEAEAVVRGILDADEIVADYATHHWVAEEEQWEPEGASTSAQPDGVEDASPWELRIELASHEDLDALAARLEPTYSVIRRWRYLLVGAQSEDEAKALAEELEGSLPEGAKLHVESSGEVAWGQPSLFAVLGGLSS